jgi:hypothetical protein
MEFKYIMFDNRLTEHHVMFANHITHSNMAFNLSAAGKPISAGFVRFVNGKLEAYGESISLKLTSRREDTAIINKNIG